MNKKIKEVKAYTDGADLITSQEGEQLIEESQKKTQNVNSFLSQQIDIMSHPDNSVAIEQLKNLSSVIVDPTISTQKDVIDLDLERLLVETKNQEVAKTGIFNRVAKEKRGEIEGLEQRGKKTVVSKIDNYYVGNNVLDNELVELINARHVEKVLIISDTAYSRHLKLYKHIVEKLQGLDIPFVEFTNVQPKLDRDLLFKLTCFAEEHFVNAIFVVGCDSTIDLSKMLLGKLLKPNFFRFQKSSRKPIVSHQFSLFSFPTVVVPEEKVNAKSLFDNSIFKKWNHYFGDTVLLSHPIDNADAVFYYPDVLLELSEPKLIELLHELYFKLIINYFDHKSLLPERERLIVELGTIRWYISTLTSGKTLVDADRKLIWNIVANSVNGTYFVEYGFCWTWYKLEASLSYLVSSKKSLGLALFLPSFLEYFAENNDFFNERCCELGAKLFNSGSAYGLVYNVIKHNESFGLPLKLLDIKEIKKIDYKLLVFLIRKSSNYMVSHKAVKAIVKNIAVW